MTAFFACMISPDVSRDRHSLLEIAQSFAYRIEMLDDGILFDVSGLERLIGKPDRVSQKIAALARQRNVPVSVAVAETPDAAILLARQSDGLDHQVHERAEFTQLSLAELDLDKEMLEVFEDLGLRRIEDLIDISREELLERFGADFEATLRRIEQKGDRLLDPNIKEDRSSWSFELDQPVEDFEQLIFVLNHGLEILFSRIRYIGSSCEHIDLDLTLRNGSIRSYQIRTSFPTLERPFWLKLVNLRASLDPPEEHITAIRATAYYTKERTEQKGLYAVARPEPEDLLLTIGKLKKLAGKENVGVPVLLNKRSPHPFELDPNIIPAGAEEPQRSPRIQPSLAFKIYSRPMAVEVLVRDGRLVFVKGREVDGHVLTYSGVWRSNSTWWERPWRIQEWDVEVEGQGVFRLCKVGREWFLKGEYD